MAEHPGLRFVAHRRGAANVRGDGRDGMHHCCLRRSAAVDVVAADSGGRCGHAGGLRVGAVADECGPPRRRPAQVVEQRACRPHDRRHRRSPRDSRVRAGAGRAASLQCALDPGAIRDAPHARARWTGSSGARNPGSGAVAGDGSCLSSNERESSRAARLCLCVVPRTAPPEAVRRGSSQAGRAGALGGRGPGCRAQDRRADSSARHSSARAADARD